MIIITPISTLPNYAVCRKGIYFSLYLILLGVLRHITLQQGHCVISLGYQHGSFLSEHTVHLTPVE